MDPLLEVVRKHWGHPELRPLQREAMTAALEGRDSLVVLPTGGGKSLCYQAPALLSEKLTVVVSPLISLMKDQVDRLLSKGVPAAFLNSSLETADRNRVQAGIARGDFRLLFVAPERFAAEGFERILEMGRVAAFAVDEAHCISHWGHDFRADYRALGRLKKAFPQASVHAFTATATPRVRADIAEQLGLKDPAILVGDFFRPNLRYRVEPRGDPSRDALREVRNHPGQAGIVYCIRRTDVDELARVLKQAGIRAEPYHAGMDDEDRTAVQDRFASGETHVIVATVAFGMGIDRADVRFVTHAAMPKSLEHYQQESGRAGRDGAPAECALFYSGQDYSLWRSIIEKNEPSDRDNSLRMLSEMYAYCTGARCRHRKLVEYFGQGWKGGPCGACDACGGALPAEPGSAELAKTLLGCIARTGQRFGPAYVAEVLRGEETDRVRERGHVSTPDFGVLASRSKREVYGWLDQLADGGFLRRDGEYGVLKIEPEGGKVLRGEASVELRALPAPSKKRSRPKKPAKATSPEPAAEEAAEPLDASGEALFEKLRRLRRTIADRRNVPVFMIFSDRTLRALARACPTTPEALLSVKGVGPAKLADFGGLFLDLLRAAARPRN